VGLSTRVRLSVSGKGGEGTSHPTETWMPARTVVAGRYGKVADVLLGACQRPSFNT
jgi:hypothetical protein